MMTMAEQILLSPPQVGVAERDALLATRDAGCIAPVGPDLPAFERQFADFTGTRHGVALASGATALHLVLVMLGVGHGDEVMVSTLSRAAVANAVAYTGARPVFVDADATTWQTDPDLLAEALHARARTGLLPKAAVATDLAGQCADYDRLLAVCDSFGVALICSAAESLGASYRDRPAGSFGVAGVFSFNRNGIITTATGGMLVTDDAERARRVRFLATQAREPALRYARVVVGFNYRMSNLLAALGRAQLADLPPKIARRREINATYRDALGHLPGVSFMPVGDHGEPNHWMTTLTVDPSQAHTDRDGVIKQLMADDIESRPAWDAVHRQAAYATAEVIGGAVADRLSEQGLRLPSGSSLSDGDLERVIATVRGVLR
jgi:dTDP-4-amino-4,6-dideoxygalactose transaminase